MTTKFKVGDRVKIISHRFTGNGPRFGEYGRITSINNYGVDVRGEISRAAYLSNYSWLFYENEIELAEPEKLYGKFQTENYSSNYKVFRDDSFCSENECQIKIKSDWLWQADDLRELAAHLERVANNLEGR